MAILPRVSRALTYSHPLSKPTVRSAPAGSRRPYATEGSASQGSGVVKQADKNAKPKIMNQTTPSELSEEAKKHNAEFQDRPDRAANTIDDQGRPHTGKKPPGGGQVDK